MGFAGTTARGAGLLFSVWLVGRAAEGSAPIFDVDAPSSTETKSPVERGNPRSFVGVGAGFLCLPGSVNSAMRPGPCFCFSLPSPSSAFFAASSTLNDISFDVPRVCFLMCAARVILSSHLPMRACWIASRYRSFIRSRSAAISAAVITLMVLLGNELRNALP